MGSHNNRDTPHTPIAFEQKRILVLGAGKEGMSVVRYMQSVYPTAQLTLADTQPVSAADLSGVELLVGNNYPTSLAQWDLTIVSPGIPPHTPLLSTAQEITTATSIFFDAFCGTTIGVTGSKGKSTTSSLIFAILKEAGLPVRLCGNIGVPALDVLRKQNTQEDIIVIELSSYQLSRLEQGPDIAVITSLFPEHIDYHGDVATYYSDKLRIVTTQNTDQLVIYNQNNSTLKKFVQENAHNNAAYPDTHGAHVQNGNIYFDNEKIMGVTDAPLEGTHNIENILGAVTVAKQYDVDNKIIRQAISHFTPLPHRLERVGTFREITFYDDAISTTPDSTIAALKAIPKVGSLFLGGLDRGYDFTTLAEIITEKQIPTIIFFPDSGATIETAMHAIGYTPKHILHTSSMKDAVAFAYAHTPKNTVSLLSCASPSYSIFKNFEDKGDQFQKYVTLLGT